MFRILYSRIHRYYIYYYLNLNVDDLYGIVIVVIFIVTFHVVIIGFGCVPTLSLFIIIIIVAMIVACTFIYFILSH